jgi:hypothetical protein
MTIIQASQIALPGMDRLQAAVEQLAAAGIEERGAVFTRREVVEFILDLIGYTTAAALLEAAAGATFGRSFFVVLNGCLILSLACSQACRSRADLRDSIRAMGTTS